MKYLSLIPIVGIVLFFVLTGIAIGLYAGGSDANPTSTSFDWGHNYWCDLLKDIAKNGQINPAKSYAIAAMMVFSASSIFFWYGLPQLLNFNNIAKIIIQSTGSFAMFITVFLFTDWHDMIITLDGLLLGVALVLTFIALYNNKLYKLLGIGMACIVVSVFNYGIYYLDILEIVLPLTQKIGMLLYVLWTWVCSIAIYQKQRLA